MNVSRIIPAADLVQPVPSRVVYIDALEMDEYTPKNGHVEFRLPCDLHISESGQIIATSTRTITLSDGKGEIRLPCFVPDSPLGDWVIRVKKSWAPYVYDIRVPVGATRISLAQIPSVRPLKGRDKQYAVTVVSATIEEGDAWNVTTTQSYGAVNLKFTTPPWAATWSKGWLPRGAVLDPLAEGVYRIASTVDAQSMTTSSGPLPKAGPATLEVLGRDALRIHRLSLSDGSGQVWQRELAGGAWGAFHRIDADPEALPIEMGTTTIVDSGDPSVTMREVHGEKLLDFVLARGAEGPYGGTQVTDPQVGSFVSSPTPTETQRSGDERWAMAATHPVLYLADGDQSATLQAWLDDPRYIGPRRVIGRFSLESTVTVPEGVTLDLSDAHITQAVGHTTLLALSAGCTLQGGHLWGLGSDYTPGTVTFAMDSIAVRVIGPDCTIRDVSIAGFGSAGIYIAGQSRTRISGVRIAGVDGYAGQSIAAGDAACTGIYMSFTALSTEITDSIITNCSIGVIGSTACSDLTLRGLRFYDIKGQHGIYAQNSTGLTIEGIFGARVAMNLVKVQLADTSSDCYAGSISNVNGYDVGTSGQDGAILVVTQTAADLTKAARHYGLTISNISGQRVFRGVYIKSLRQATITGLNFGVVTGDAVTLWDVQDCAVEAVSVKGSGKSGVVVTSGGGGATQRLRLSGLRLHNPGKYGIQMACASDGIDGRDITIDGLDVSSVDARMDYGLWMAGGHQETLRVRNANVVGQKAGVQPYRLQSPTRGLGEWHNVSTGGVSPALFPSALPVYVGSLGPVQCYATAATTTPRAGVWSTGDRIERSVVGIGQSIGWVCVSAGGASSATWATNAEVSVGTWWRLSTGHVLECTVAGTTGASEPTPPAIKGDAVTDGSVTWVYRYQASAVFRELPKVGT